MRRKCACRKAITDSRFAEFEVRKSGKCSSLKPKIQLADTNPKSNAPTPRLTSFWCASNLSLTCLQRIASATLQYRVCQAWSCVSAPSYLIFRMTIEYASGSLYKLCVITDSRCSAKSSERVLFRSQASTCTLHKLPAP